MLTEILIELYERDLNKLKNEIVLYKNENDLWKLENGIKNSTGNLAIHIVGSLNHFIGAVIGNTGYVRERDKEFSDKNVPVTKILSEIDALVITIKNVLESFSDADLQKNYPIDFLEKQVPVIFVLTQSLVHLNYHLGQINYHRRLLE